MEKFQLRDWNSGTNKGQEPDRNLGTLNVWSRFGTGTVEQVNVSNW